MEAVTSDTQNNSKTIIKMYIGGTMMGVWANEEFTPSRLYYIVNPGNIQKGFIPIDASNWNSLQRCCPRGTKLN